MAHKLLLADDSVTIQRVIELTFADEDIEVIAVGDGERAVQRIREDRPDIVLADVDMPERDGFAVARYVKDDPELAHIKVILLTGAFDPVDETRVRAAGCDGVLAKPFEPQLLIARVRELLAGSQRKAAPPAVLPAPTPRVASQAASASDHQAGPPAAPGPLQGDRPEATAVSLDDYFDQLDAAFASHGFTLDESDAARPPFAGPPENAAGVGAMPIANREGQNTRIVPAVVPPLDITFSALLAAEQASRGTGSLGQPAAPIPFFSVEAIVDEISRRVAERVADHSVREQVADIVSRIADRLVREEIERVKASIK